MSPSPLIVALLGFTVGCADGAGPVVDQNTQAIVGASEDDDHDEAAVLVEIKTASGDTGSCTGVVVAPRVVLTAAHCAAPQAVGLGATFSIFLGDDPRSPNADDSHVPVVAANTDPDFDLTLLQAGHDVAVLVTAAALPAPPLAFEPAPPLAHVADVRVVGFGVTDLNDPSAGRRRDATIALARFDDRFLELGLSDSAPCLGDSGGPAFVKLEDGTEALAGIVSFTDPRCGPFARVSRLAPYTSFIQSSINESEQAPGEGNAGGCAIRPALESGGEARALATLALLGAYARSRTRRATPRRAKSRKNTL